MAGELSGRRTRQATDRHPVSFVQSSRRPGLRILFVENHEVFSSVVTGKFLAAHEVRIVNTLRDARLELAAGAFDLILLDDHLDDGPGENLLGDLPAANRPMVIGVSAYDDLNAELVRAGADAACGKLEFSQIDSLIRSLQN